MNKEEYLRELYLFDQEIRKLRKKFKKKWPKTPPSDSLENKEWWLDVLRIMHRFPEIEFGFLYSGNEGIDFIGRKPIWLDPNIQHRKGYDKFEGEERKELLFKHRREMGRLLFESVRIVIPIYPDTTKEDIEQIWPRIEKLKKVAYGKVPTPKKSKWEENIEIYKFGQNKEFIEEFTRKPGAPWSNLANELGITPQACGERYQSIKRFINLHTEEQADRGKKKKAEVTNEQLDCQTCDRNRECQLFTIGKGECLIFEKTCKAEIPSQSYISIDKIENKKARDYGHWKAEEEFIDSLSDDIDEQ